ncbi:FUSC family protein [Robinsoniella peoriensis]|uniref:YtxH domain-containing protein n=1 Tax=Robinsoniella peoriensis TaxID=180332 RepID=A0A4V6HRH9_9FIRM|nr:FUSC family protein [Robinsoniella peoriensis]TLC99167.1 hypothetical protein DSM106044_03945 [Robinsoniella peoriensis]
MLAVKRKYLFIGMALFSIVIFFVLCQYMNVHASGLIDDTIDAGNNYSKYANDNYQLDFYVDKSWDWLPWNWGDGIGNTALYAVYLITDALWGIVRLVSSATGYVVQEAFKLDFIKDMTGYIGNNIQQLAGVSPKGISGTGFYPSLLGLFLVILGGYVTYTGMLKKEVTKAINTVVTFVLVFLLTTGFLAYAPFYVEKLNDFSSDFSTEVLNIGTSVTMPDSGIKNRDSADLIRDLLFDVQIYKPWLLLQFGSTDVEKARAESILSISPDEEHGEKRTEAVKTEIEDNNNNYLSVAKAGSRLGTVLLLLIVNLVISYFVLLLTGLMILSQVLFIVYALFLVIAFILSLLPTYSGMAKRAVEKVFHIILTRVGVTMILVVAFSISSMFYNVSEGYPFFMIAFLQIVTFVGIYVKMGDILGMIGLQSNGEGQLGSKMMRPMRSLQRRARVKVGRANRTGRAMLAGVVGGLAGSRAGTKNKQANTHAAGNMEGGRSYSFHDYANKASQRKQNGEDKKKVYSASGFSERSSDKNRIKPNLGEKVGSKVAGIAGMPKGAVEKAKRVKDNVVNAPTSALYAVNRAKDSVSNNVKGGRSGFQSAAGNKQQERQKQNAAYQTDLARKREDLRRRKQEKQNRMQGESGRQKPVTMQKGTGGVTDTGGKETYRSSDPKTAEKIAGKPYNHAYTHINEKLEKVRSKAVTGHRDGNHNPTEKDSAVSARNRGSENPYYESSVSRTTMLNGKPYQQPETGSKRRLRPKRNRKRDNKDL